MRKNRRRGVVLVTMAMAAVAVFAVVGLAVDVGRIFIAKNETQTFCDAAATAAALALDGGTAGITRAQNVVAASPNKWSFGTAAVSSPAVGFATSPAGPWMSNPSPATGYIYVRVTATVTVPLYFLPVAVAQGAYDVVSTSAAGQIPIAGVSRGVAPFTAISTNSAGPNFGLTVGSSYDIQWPQYNGTRAQCSVANPSACFNSPPCPGDSVASQAAVVANWQASYSGYWGSTSNSSIQQEILDLIQLAPVATGTNIQPVLTTGNKMSEAVYLDERASQDGDTSSSTVSVYLSSATHNGRRLIPVAIVNPVSPAQTTVNGYGQFLLSADGSPSSYYKKNTNGNDPFCAIYAGPYNIGSIGPGAGGGGSSGSGASVVKLIQ